MMPGLFPDPYAAAADLREDRLSGPLFSGATLSQSYIERTLAAAQQDAERALRVYFGPVEVLPDDGDQQTRDALSADGVRWVEDPGYDLDPKFFQGDRWGFLRLRHRPVSAIASIRFLYPHPYSGVFEVPADWIRLDKRAGDINLVPGTQSFTAPLSAWVMQVMGGGRSIPRMIQIRYTAGLSGADEWPDVADLVMQMAALRVLKNLMLPGSGSISADGLSQSTTVAVKDYQEDIDARLERLRQSIHGIQVTCL